MIFKLNPIFKYKVWGGNKISKLCYSPSEDKIGEAWVLSCIGNETNLITPGVVEPGTTLRDIFWDDRNIIAKGYSGDFPLLIKIIDAKQDLSIQVHPSTKTEFWHILNAKTSKINFGFKKDTTRAEVREAIENFDLLSLVNKVKVKKGDNYLITPGTIHSICAGTFLIEIQQSSDITYRLYDYDRVDKNGLKRPLNIKEGLDCLDYNKSKPFKSKKGENLITCKYFKVYKYEIKSKKEFVATDESFNTITCIGGKGSITCGNQKMTIDSFDTIFVTASSGKYELSGKMTIILTTL